VKFNLHHFSIYEPELYCIGISLVMGGLLNLATGHRPKEPKCEQGTLTFTCKMPVQLNHTDQEEIQNGYKAKQRNCKRHKLAIKRS